MLEFYLLLHFLQKRNSQYMQAWASNVWSLPCSSVLRIQKWTTFTRNFRCVKNYYSRMKTLKISTFPMGYSSTMVSSLIYINLLILQSLQTGGSFCTFSVILMFTFFLDTVHYSIMYIFRTNKTCNLLSQCGCHQGLRDFQLHLYLILAFVHSSICLILVF